MKNRIMASDTSPTAVAYVTRYSQAAGGLGLGAGFTAINISEPTAMYEMDHIANSAFNYAARGGDVAVDSTNQVAYVSADGKVTSVDISSPSVSILEADTNTAVNDSKAIAIDIANSVAYVVSPTDEYLVSIDISDPSSMSNLDAYATAAGANILGVALDTANSIAYYAAYAGDAVCSVDISNPSAITSIDSQAYNSAYDVVVDTTNLDVYVSRPEDDSVSSVTTDASGNLSANDTLANGIYLNEPKKMAIDISNSLLFVAADDYLTIIDISDPSSLSIEGYISDADLGTVIDVALDTANSMAYAVGTEDKIVAIDYSTPSSPTKISSYESNGLDGASAIALDLSP
jgi:hypothetical protein